MNTLVVVLTSIGLLDSTSMIPISIVPIVILLSSRKPYVGSAAFLSGIFVTYFLTGLLMLFGLNSVFDSINAYLTRWMKEPHMLELVFQVVLGILLFYFGIRPAKARQNKGDRGVGDSVTPLQAFTVAAGLVIIGIPGAIPYLAAIDQILRTDLSFIKSTLALLYYNIVFILPMTAMVFIRVIFRKQSDRILGAISRFMDKWLAHIIKVLLVLLGAAMVVDGVFWMLGKPLVQV